MGLVVTELLITSPVVRWRGWETPPPPPQHSGSTVILCMTSSEVSRAGGRGIQLTYSSVSIRKNVFWLKKNSICSDRILTFGIRSRFKLRRDGDQCGLPEAIVAGAVEDVAED